MEGLLVVRPAANRVPALDRDAKNGHGDDQGDDRVSDGQPERHEHGASDDAETDQSIGAGVVAAAISAGLSSRFPARSRTCAAISLPTNPITPAKARVSR